MAFTRVFVLARDADHPSVDVLRILSGMGHEARSHMASVSDDVRRDVLERLKQEDALKPKPEAVAKPLRPPREKKPAAPRPKVAKPKKVAEPEPHPAPVAVVVPAPPPEPPPPADVEPVAELAPPVAVEPEPVAPSADAAASAATVTIDVGKPKLAPPAASPAQTQPLAVVPGIGRPASTVPLAAAPPAASASPAVAGAPAPTASGAVRTPKAPPSSVTAAAEAARAATAHTAIVKAPLPPPRAPYRPGQGPRFPQRYQGRPSGPATRSRPASPASPSRPVAPPEPPPIKGSVALSEGVTVKEMAEKLGVKSREVMARLLDRRILATINQTLDVEIAKQVARDFGFDAEILTFEQDAMRIHESVTAPVEEVVASGAVSPERRVLRPPVVTVMGHVDHGKTSLLDAIRETKVTESEFGGITQHIGAYHVDVGQKRVVFLDTPGHEAFTLMRARGAKATDIVVLVVAADDGVMPQTIEAIHHARAASVPIVVAINKIDKPGAQSDRVKQQLTEHGLTAEDWGGETVMVEVSAKQRKNLDLLLEMILLVAEMLDLKADPGRPGSGVVLEAELDKQKGPKCNVLIQAGTLRLGDSFIAGAEWGKVRAMFDDRGRKVDEAPPASAVEVMGLAGVPRPGDLLQVVDEAKARQIGVLRQERIREQSMQKSSRLSLDHLHAQVAAGEIKELPIILKADVQGSVEVLQDALARLSTEKVKVRLIHTQAGAVSVSDVLLASASNAIIYGFNVRPERKAQELATKEAVEIRLHTVIYDIANEIKAAMSGLLEPIKKEVFLGRAEVKEVFRVPKIGNVAGVYVSEGRITRTAEARLLRDNVVVWMGKLASLRRYKEDATEVKNGLECGIGLQSYHDIKVGDVIEAFVTEMIAQTA